MNKDSGLVPPNGDGSLLGLGLLTSLPESLSLEELLSWFFVEASKRVFLLLNLFRKLDFLKLNVDFVVLGLSVSSISFDIFSCSLGLVFLRLLILGLNEGLLNAASLDDKDLNFGRELDKDGDVASVDLDDCLLFGFKSGLFPLFKKLNLLNRPVADVDGVESDVPAVVVLLNVTFL